MLLTNQTTSDIYFGPLHLAGGIGQQLTVDDTSATSLYLTDDGVADALNNAYTAGNITVSSQALPFPRPTGTPHLLHGTGNPEGIVYAPQGSIYMRRDGTGANNVYTKTTGVTLATGWQNYTTTATGPGTTYRKTSAKAVTNTTSETDLLNGEITIGAGVISPTGIARLTAIGDWIQNSGSYVLPRPRFKLKLGGGATVVIDTGTGSQAGQRNVAPNSNRWGWKCSVEVRNLGATNSQAVYLSLELTLPSDGAAQANFTTGEGSYWDDGASNVAYASGFNTAAIDTAAAMAVLLTVTNPTATATCETKLYNALVEII